jgi:hypothetical protein
VVLKLILGDFMTIMLCKYIISCYDDSKQVLTDNGFDVDEIALEEIANDIIREEEILSEEDISPTFMDWIIGDYIIYVLSKDTRYSIEKCFDLFKSLELELYDDNNLFCEHFSTERDLDFSEVQLLIE